MRKFIPFLEYLTVDLKESLPVSQGTGLTRKNYRMDFEDYDLIPVELDLIEVWWEWEESMDTMLDHNSLEEEEEEEDDFDTYSEYTSFVETEIEISKVGSFDYLELNWFDAIRTNYCLYATFSLDLFLVSSFIRMEDYEWEDSLLTCFQHPIPFPIKEVLFRLMFTFSLHSIFIIFFFMYRFRFKRDYVSYLMPRGDFDFSLQTKAPKAEGVYKGWHPTVSTKYYLNYTNESTFFDIIPDLFQYPLRSKWSRRRFWYDLGTYYVELMDSFDFFSEHRPRLIVFGRRVMFFPRRNFADEGFEDLDIIPYNKRFSSIATVQNYPMDYLNESIRLDFSNKFFRYCYEWCESIIIRAALRYKYKVKKNKVKKFATEIDEEIYHLEKQLGIKPDNYRPYKKDKITELMDMGDLLEEENNII